MKLMKMFVISAVALTATSCVSKKQYDILNSNYKQAIENVAERQREIQDLKAKNAGLLSENNLLKEHSVFQLFFCSRLLSAR